MKTDRELLVLAAKAVGLDWVKPTDVSKSGRSMWITAGVFWKPLDDDGDALRLAVKLNMDIYTPRRWYVGKNDQLYCSAVAFINGKELREEMPVKLSDSVDPAEVTRRVIVQLAATIAEVKGGAA